ncbi:MAG TPA: GSU2403 family nucleotidyltransferase fold protein [Acetobacteraceae bacterium]|nr:GSU2403 family nucleotidyltransferase fold protein [Acetobacteraceae bacterium]
MPSELPLALQTVYAELLDRVVAAEFRDVFPSHGTFVAKTVRGRRYWHFQHPAEQGRRRRYVGPETPELLEQIARHKVVKGNRDERRAPVSTLVRSARLPRPSPPIGDVAAALADAGVFRLRGVLVGTVAYQAYPAKLGERLPAALLQTQNVDIAQFADVSIAVEDATPPIAHVLAQLDRSLRPMPHVAGPQYVTAFTSGRAQRVEFLTPNRGPDSDRPRRLPAFGVDAQPLRFLDFLIRDPEHAVLLHGAGVHVLVPAPQRYTLHKLILARRRSIGEAKVGEGHPTGGLIA